MAEASSNDGKARQPSRRFGRDFYLIGGVNTQKVDYLSQTYEGKRHDKKIVDEEDLVFPKDSSLYKDTGFQGYAPEGVINIPTEEKAQR